MVPERIALLLREVPDWALEETRKAIRRTFHFSSFDEAMAFTNIVAAIGRKHGHLPAIDIRVTRVELRLTTPQADGLSDQDFDLAKKIDRWVDEHRSC